ncbi:hypothetical protein [Tunturiibacter gelidiferens]|uniref:hypothetical protein n=1 Tax=Tunturiibacter gelidiferens TaxID=3069689 RepID=UPI003D9B4786
MTIVWFVVGCAVGGVIAWLIRSSRSQLERTAAEARAVVREAEVAGLREGVAAKDRLIEEKAREVETLRKEAEGARLEAGRLLERLQAEQKAAEEKIQALIDVEKSLKTSFQALAGKRWMRTASDWWRWQRASWISSRWSLRRIWRRRSRRLRCC